MKLHRSIPGLSFRRSGAHFYLEIAFDSRPRDEVGAQWVTIHGREPTSAALPSVGDEFPREVTRGEEEIRIGRVRRVVQISSDPVFPGSERRLLGLTLSYNSPYRLVRHTRQPDGTILDEEIYPWPSDEEIVSRTISPGLWN